MAPATGRYGRPMDRRLTFRSWKTGTMTMWWMPADRSGPAQLLTNIGSMQSPESWSPDGKTLAFTQMDDPQSGSDIYVLPLDGDRKPQASGGRSSRRARRSSRRMEHGWPTRRTSPDSRKCTRWPTRSRARRFTISTNGGTDPLWRHDGRQLYYRLGDLMMVVDVSYGRSLEASKPRVLWTGQLSGRRGLVVRDGGPDVCQLRRHAGWRALPDD